MSPEQRLQSIVQRLKERGQRLTPQRVAIIKAVLKHTGHPTVEELHRQILKDFPTTSLATVYKTVHLLKEDKEVLELGFGDLSSRYDGLKPYPHPHLICTKCGKILDSESEGFSRMVEELAQKNCFSVQSHRFDIFGLCAQCRSGKISS